MKFEIEVLENLISIDNHKELIESLNQLASRYEGKRKLAVIAFLYLFVSLLKKAQGNINSGGIFAARSLLPIGAGLGSSASYSTCIATALLIYFNLIGIENTQEEECIREINRMSFEAERILHGNPSGIDNTVSVYGGAKFYQNGVFGPVRGFHSMKFLLVNTKVDRDTKTLVAHVRELKEKYPLIVNPIIESIDGISQSFEKLCQAQDEFNSISFEETKKMINWNHELLRLLEVSHEELEKIRRVAKEHGFACKLTGAGGGGCALILITPDTSNAQTQAIQKEMGLSGYQCFEVELGCPGLMVKSISELECSFRTNHADEILTSFLGKDSDWLGKISN